MVPIHIVYQGNLRCQVTHKPSGWQLTTDAPLDNEGLGQSFSPTDLVAAAAGACMATIMGIVARRKGIALDGMEVKVNKHMTQEGQRRIERLEIDLQVPLAANHPERRLLESAARGCPVHYSLHPDVELVINWHWLGPIHS